MLYALAKLDAFIRGRPDLTREILDRAGITPGRLAGVPAAYQSKYSTIFGLLKPEAETKDVVEHIGT
jgi:hypothetical protein